MCSLFCFKDQTSFFEFTPLYGLYPGTGAYAFYLADKGHNLTATDITPRHIKIINEQLKDKTYSMKTKVLDATDMGCFEDERFDVVLNMVLAAGEISHPQTNQNDQLGTG